MKTIYIKDYVSLPCSDAAEGIRRAVSDAKSENADCIQFEEGIYPLQTFIPFKTDLTAHDAGAELISEKDVYILLNGLSNIKFIGKCDENGNPLTVLEGGNNLKLHDLLPTILWADCGENITIENFKFKRNPEFASSGQVKSVNGDNVILEVFEGNPCYDNMGTYCLNKFTPDGNLDGESLSYGFGLDENFKLIGNRTLSLKSDRVASMVKENDIISFHQGAKTDFQCFFGNIKNLTLKNLHTANSNGFAHLAFNIHNLNIENVKFKPEGNQYFTAPRDAFKLHKCSGEIRVYKMYVEGVRMDGQNMHSNYLFPIEILSDRKMKVITPYSYIPLEEGSDIEFYFGTEKKTEKIKSAIHLGLTERDRRIYQIFEVTFEKEMPYNVTTETLCLASCWEPSLYECRNSVFTNIAGAGHLSRIDHIRISDCSYKNLMNSGILLGAEFPTHMEGGHATDVVIENCTFDNCGNTARYDAMGCIGIKSSGLPGKNNKDIHVKNCKFSNSKIGIDIHDAENVTIENCTFDNINEKIRTDFSTCDKISVDFL